MRFFGPRAAKCSAHLRLGDENVGESLNFFVWPCHNKQLNGITLQMAQRVVEKRAMEWFGQKSFFAAAHVFSMRLPIVYYHLLLFLPHNDVLFVNQSTHGRYFSTLFLNNHHKNRSGCHHRASSALLKRFY